MVLRSRERDHRSLQGEKAREGNTMTITLLLRSIFVLSDKERDNWTHFQVQEHRHSGGSDRYSVLEEPQPRLAHAQGQGHEDNVVSKLEEHIGKKRSPQNEQQYLIDVTASVPVAVPLLTHPDLLRCVFPYK